MAPKRRSKYADHPMVRYVRSLDGDFYLTKEAAAMIGCTPALLSYLAAKHPGENLGPTHRASYGSKPMMLYTGDRIEEIKNYLAGQRLQHGRKSGVTRLFTPMEIQDRRRVRSRIYEYEHRAVTYDADGRANDAEKLRAEAARLRDELKRTNAERKAVLRSKTPRPNR